MTNRLFSLAILFAIAALVLMTPMARDGASGQATFCLGFILLFGYYLAKMLERLRLPAISSYILVGIVCGPFVLNLLSKEVVSHLQLFDDAALAIIALMAGGELKASVLRLRARAFSSVIAGQVVLSVVVVFVVLAAMRGHLGTLPVATGRELAAVALLLGLITMARSPSTTMGVIAESRAKGPMTELLIGVTVILDVVVLVMAAVFIPAAVVLSAEGSEFSMAFARTLVVEIVASIGVGVLFGMMCASYIKWVGNFLPLFLIGIGFVGSAVCHHYHLKPLLAFMIAGFYVQNFSPLGATLIRGLERSAFPVYVIFFAISGASIDLQALRAMWVIALVLVFARAAAFYLGTLGAAAVARDIRPYAHSLWSGFLSQAGVTIGLAALIERQVDWGGQLKTLILAVVALNQLIGPIALKYLLDRKGEAGGMDRDPAQPPA